MPSIGQLGIGLNKRRGGGLTGIALYNAWFLASGTWDNDGIWVDIVPWVDEWFLASGSINVFGNWNDGEAW